MKVIHLLIFQCSYRHCWDICCILKPVCLWLRHHKLWHLCEECNECCRPAFKPSSHSKRFPDRKFVYDFLLNHYRQGTPVNAVDLLLSHLHIGNGLLTRSLFMISSQISTTQVPRRFSRPAFKLSTHWKHSPDMQFVYDFLLNHYRQGTLVKSVDLLLSHLHTGTAFLTRSLFMIST